MSLLDGLIEKVTAYINQHYEDPALERWPSKLSFDGSAGALGSIPIGDYEVVADFACKGVGAGESAGAGAGEAQIKELLEDKNKNVDILDEGAVARAGSVLRAPARRQVTLEDILDQRGATFSEALLFEIDARGLTDPEVYKRAHLDRKLFSKIRSNVEYQPKKSTAISLALALNMNLDETMDFIGRAGYTLSNSSKSDLIIMYFLEQEFWDLMTINEVLHKFNQPILGC